MHKIHIHMGSGCDSVGRAVASDSRGPRFESSHQQEFILNIYCQLYWKDENKKEAENGPFKKRIFWHFPNRSFYITFQKVQLPTYLPGTATWIHSYLMMCHSRIPTFTLFIALGPGVDVAKPVLEVI